MSVRIKKIFSRIFKNKKAIFAFLFLIILGSLFFGQLTYVQGETVEELERLVSTTAKETSTGSGGVMEELKKLGENVAFAVIISIPFVFAEVAAFIAALATTFLRWVISDGFMNVSYTNPNNNDLIKTGLSITQSFVNMILVLVLVYIALATILRLAGHETRKLLVTFIIVALLVNFAPVICGVVVDASNITMNVFFGGASTGNLENSAGTEFISRAKTVKTIAVTHWDTAKKTEGASKSITTMIRAVMFLMMIGITYLLAAFIYALFAFVFIFRYLAIWILVILSPIAFACYILPGTRKLFSMWWNQFIQWSIVGITCGFFLYLAEQFIKLSAKNQEMAPSTIPGGTLGSEVLPLFIPLGLLTVGLVVGLQTAAMGATTVMGLTKKSGRWLGGKVWQKGIRPTFERVAKPATGLAVKGLESLRDIRGEGPLTKPLAFGARTMAKPLSWFLPEEVKKYAEWRPRVMEAQKAVKDWASSKTLGRQLKTGVLQGADAAGAMLEMIDARGDSQDIVKAWKKEGQTDQDVFSNKKFLKMLETPFKIAQNSGLLGSKYLRQDPRLARAVIGKKWAGKEYEKIGEDLKAKNISQEEAEERAVKLALVDTKPANINQWEKEVLQDKAIIKALFGKGDRNILESINRGVKRGTDTAMETIDDVYTEFVDREEISHKVGAHKKIENGIEIDDAWREFEEKMIKQNDGKKGYFESIKEQRIRGQGWGVGTYKGAGAAPTTPPITPGGAAGAGTPPPRPKKPPLDTGTSRRKRRRTPDVGKP